MMTDLETKHAIRFALGRFSGGELGDNAREFFGVLGYRSDKRPVGVSTTPQAFIATYTGNKPLNTKNALVSEWQSAELIFQLTTSEIAHVAQRTLFESDRQVDGRIIESYVFIAIGLKGAGYTRTQLATITREVNKVFPMPALVLFQHGSTLTLAVIDRRLHKRDESKDVLEKVTLIKDVRISAPHRAHEAVLFDLSLDRLRAKFDIPNWVQLHEAWRQTLDTSELNKTFFREVANWYFWAQTEVNFPKGAGNNEDERKAISVIRLITRLIFVWFIKEKGLVPDALFDETGAKHLLGAQDMAGQDSTYYKAILQNVFFGTLNTEMDKRGFRHQPRQSGGRSDDYLSHNRYRYESSFANPNDFLKLCEPIPFLNGGLFECLDKREDGIEIRIDGFSDRPDNELRVPNDLFFGEERDIDLNEVFGTSNKQYRVRGLIHTFNRYKFTVDENTPIEEEIALDPELLGKVFENLLASYNPETGITARKQTGSFYTPREIVNYMVDESLEAYLLSRLNRAPGDSSSSLRERVKHLLAYNDEEPRFSLDEKKQLITAIDALKALDPTCGSGAFPMGLLHKLVHLLRKLDPDNRGWKGFQTNRAETISNEKDRTDELQDIKEVFSNKPDFARKLYLIENCIFGVDIQPIAVQIAKLRCFISLVIDNKVDISKPNRGIRPLPNLETKFVAANSLLTIDRPKEKPADEQRPTIPPSVAEKRDELIEVMRQFLRVRTLAGQNKWLQQGEALADDLNHAFSNYPGFVPLNVNWIFTTSRSVDALVAQLPGARPQEQASALMLRSPAIIEKEKELAEARRRHFAARTQKTKDRWRDRDRVLRSEIGELLKTTGWADEAAERLAMWNPYDQNTAAGFFDAEWMFGLTGGFDLVIGNPPYLRVQGIQKTQPEAMPYYRQHFNSAQGNFDLYALFIERGYELLDSNGHFAYIVPHKFFQASFGEGLRRLLTQHGALRQIVRFGSAQVFEESTTYTCLLFLSAQPNANFDLLEVKTLDRGEEVLEAARRRAPHPDYAHSRLQAPSDRTGKLDWDFAVGEHQKVMHRLLQHECTLGDITRKIFVGLQTSADKIYVLETRSERRDTVVCYSKHLDEEVEIERGLVKPFLMGKDVHRYEKVKSRNVVIFPYQIRDGKAELMPPSYIRRNFPQGWRYLKRNEQDLSDREAGQMRGDEFYAYIYPKNLAEFETPKIMTPEIALGCQMTVDTKGVFYHTTKVYSFAFKSQVAQSMQFMLGVLNSKVLWYFLTNTGYVLRGGYYTFKTEYLKPFPIASSTENQERAVHTLVDYVLHLKAQAQPSDVSAAAELRVMVAFFEQLIDALVYEMYFPEEFNEPDKRPSSLLTPEVLPDINSLRGNKTAALRELFHRLYDPSHPVRALVFFLDTVETVRVIDAKTKTS